MRLSAVVLTHNEEKDILECLKGLNFCDEVLVIDSGSTDQTVKLASQFGAHVYYHSFTDFSDSRNFGLSKSKGDWVLFVDADERVPDQLKKEIIQKISREEGFEGFYFRRQDFAFGKWLKWGETAQVRLLRLAKRNSGRWRRRVHEVWEIKGQAEELKTPLEHYSHQSVEEFVKKINLYSNFDAREHFESGRRAPSWHLLAYPLGKFIQNYLARQGFRDGVIGLLFALLMSFNSFLIRAKLLLLWRKDAHRN